MSVQMAFILGAPRSGTTMLERMLSCHSQILGGPEPHLLTPLAHMGYWAKPDEAAYDIEEVSKAQATLVSKLDGGEAHYYAACRAYCDVLYGAYLNDSNKSVCLDKTPAYTLVWPFITKVFPEAHYIALTRHPLAVFASYANSFFCGDYEAAHDYNPILTRYVPALAGLLRQKDTPVLHVQYETLVMNPEQELKRVHEFMHLSFEPDGVHYGTAQSTEPRRKGLGDPIGVEQNTQPQQQSVQSWAGELANSAKKRRLMESIVASLDAEDLRTIGYPPDELWAPLAAAEKAPPPKRKRPPLKYWLERKTIIVMRRAAQRHPLLRKLLRGVQHGCEALAKD